MKPDTAPSPDSEAAADIAGFEIPATPHNSRALRELVAFGIRAGALYAEKGPAGLEELGTVVLPRLEGCTFRNPPRSAN